MKRMVKDCVAPLNSQLYKLYIDDTIINRKRNATNDELFANMNSHHKSIKLTVTNPKEKNQPNQPTHKRNQPQQIP